MNPSYDWFLGVLLPEGYETLLYNDLKPFKNIDKYLEHFAEKEIKYEFQNVIGKIKCVWKSEGRLMVAGYIQSNFKGEENLFLDAFA